ncbi:hypothetical protein LMG23994_00314 [Cupriavidus pinatubonensis]|uniref:Uncharacterized protein n=1 Tax=Cupriavidus pinatubonensis TaxID=248026 RepID=A0ABN7XUT1_9BURK|nr:hypothetical protein LMG23994_00314 [Cupriavidus pinatubonensis]
MFDPGLSNPAAVLCSVWNVNKLGDQRKMARVHMPNHPYFLLFSVAVHGLAKLDRGDHWIKAMQLAPNISDAAKRRLCNGESHSKSIGEALEETLGVEYLNTVLTEALPHVLR